MSDTSTPLSPPSLAQSPGKSEKKRKLELEEIEVKVDAEEPISKKAKRALKKGKTVLSKSEAKKKQKKIDDTEDLYVSKPEGEGEGKGSSEKAAKAKRSEYGVWIGNLSFSMTVNELRTWFVENSGGSVSLESMSRVHMPKSKLPGPHGSKEKPNRGFAYVDFVDQASQVAALALTETPIGPRRVLIKDAKSFDGRPTATPAANENGEDKAADSDATGTTTSANAAKSEATNPKIFVGNLAFDVNEDTLWEHFQVCGEIDWCKVATFEDSGKCKGYGWVKFRNPESAEWAVKGFVKLKEEIPTEEDFQVDSAAQEGGEEETDKKKATTQKKTQKRKWWVNRLQGRELKISLAQSDEFRYKKRFGKAKGE